LGTSYKVGILRSRLFSPLAVVIATASAEKMFFEVDAARTLFSVQSNLQQQRPAQTLQLSGCLSRPFLF
jgi:hypothetical protein